MDFNFLNKKEQSPKGKKPPKQPRFAGNILGAVLFFILITALYLAVSGGEKETAEISISELAQHVVATEVDNIEVAGDKLVVTYRSGEVKISKKEADSSLTQTLANYGVPADALAGN